MREDRAASPRRSPACGRRRATAPGVFSRGHAPEGARRREGAAVAVERWGTPRKYSFRAPMQTIALLTDFGTRDPYVAAMKGVIASRCEARIADLTHCIAPFDVWEGAFFLRDVVAYWPEGTVFVCIVDPGVGSSRRILALESAGRFFLAPDNGLLHFVLKESRFVGGGFLAHPPPRPLGMTATTFGGAVFSVTNESLFLPRGSTTF